MRAQPEATQDGSPEPLHPRDGNEGWVCWGAGVGTLGRRGALGASPQMLAPGQRHHSLLTQVGEEECANILTPTKCQVLS